MADEVRDPNEELAEMDLDNIEMGFTDDDLEDVVDDVRGDLFLYSGVQCRVRKKHVESTDESITKSQQEFWFAEVEVDWPDEVMFRVQELFESDIWDTNAGWVSVRVGHERVVSREEAEDEAEWLAEQVVMLKNDPNAPV